MRIPLSKTGKNKSFCLKTLTTGLFLTALFFVFTPAVTTADSTPKPLVCTPFSQEVGLERHVSFFASGGGNGVFKWGVADGSPIAATGPSFTTSFSSSGSRQIRVAKGDQSTTCRVNVLPAATPTPTPTPIINSLNVKNFGKDISRGDIGEQSSLITAPDRTLEFTIRIRSFSSSTLFNLFVSNSLPSGFSYIDNSTSVNGAITRNGIATSGINLGSLGPGQEIVIKFKALTAGKNSFAIGTTNFINTVQIRADNISQLSAQMPVSVINGVVAGISTISRISTGTAGSLALSLLVSLVVTVSYMAYAQSGLFKRRDLLAVVRRQRSRRDRFNFVK